MIEGTTSCSPCKTRVHPHKLIYTSWHSLTATGNPPPHHHHKLGQGTPAVSGKCSWRELHLHVISLGLKTVVLAYHRVCSCSRHTVYQTFSSFTCRGSCHAAAANTLPFVLQVVLVGLKGTHRHTIAAFPRPSSVWGLRQRQQILQDPRDKEYLRSEFNGSIWRAHMALKGIPKVPSQT